MALSTAQTCYAAAVQAQGPNGAPRAIQDTADRYAAWVAGKTSEGADEALAAAAIAAAAEQKGIASHRTVTNAATLILQELVSQGGGSSGGGGGGPAVAGRPPVVELQLPGQYQPTASYMAVAYSDAVEENYYGTMPQLTAWIDATVSPAQLQASAKLRDPDALVPSNWPTGLVVSQGASSDLMMASGTVRGAEVGGGRRFQAQSSYVPKDDLNDLTRFFIETLSVTGANPPTLDSALGLVTIPSGFWIVSLQFSLDMDYR